MRLSHYKPKSDAHDINGLNDLRIKKQFQLPYY